MKDSPLCLKGQLSASDAPDPPTVIWPLCIPEITSLLGFLLSDLALLPASQFPPL